VEEAGRLDEREGLERKTELFEVSAMVPRATDRENESARAREFWRRVSFANWLCITQTDRCVRYALPFETESLDDTPRIEPVPGFSAAVINPSPKGLPSYPPIDTLPLAAFAQLGALRMNAERCLIAFFDEISIHVYAEATPKLSLMKTDKKGDGEKELLLGESVVPRGMCTSYEFLHIWDPPVHIIQPHPIVF